MSLLEKNSEEGKEKNHYMCLQFALFLNKAEAPPFCDTSALLLSCRRWFRSGLTNGAKEFNETLNHNPHNYDEHTDIYHR